MTKILIVDDHPLVGDGISTMIQDVPYLHICALAKTVSAAMTAVREHRPDVILLDISLPDGDGLKALDMIRNIDKRVRVLALTSTNEAGIISQFLARGGNGFLLKNMERQELIDAIDAVEGGKIFLSQAANQKVLEQFQNVHDAVRQTPVLTRREKEILHLLGEGLTGPQIAGKLFLSAYTVETHRKNLMQKLNARSTQMLLKIAKEQRLF